MIQQTTLYDQLLASSAEFHRKRWAAMPVRERADEIIRFLQARRECRPLRRAVQRKAPKELPPTLRLIQKVRG